MFPETIALLLAAAACCFALAGNTLAMAIFASAAFIFSLLFCPWWE